MLLFVQKYLLFLFVCFLFFIFVVTGIKPRASFMLGKHSTTELYPQQEVLGFYQQHVADILCRVPWLPINVSYFKICTVLISLSLILSPCHHHPTFFSSYSSSSSFSCCCFCFVNLIFLLTCAIFHMLLEMSLLNHNFHESQTSSGHLGTCIC
jgi:hypothetical protein